MFVVDEDFAGFAAFVGTDDTEYFELVHNSAGAIVSEFEAALYHGGGAYLVLDDDAGCVFEEFVEVFDVEVGLGVFGIGVVGVKFGEEVWFGVSGLFGDEVNDAFDFGGVHEGALYADDFSVNGEEHVAASDELFGTTTVEDGSGVYFGGYFEGDAGWEVGFDNAGDDVDGWSLGGYDEVYSDGAGELGEATDGEFYFFSGGHNHVGKFVYDEDDEWEVTVSFFGI